MPSSIHPCSCVGTNLARNGLGLWDSVSQSPAPDHGKRITKRPLGWFAYRGMPKIALILVAACQVSYSLPV